jgi:hypothetical protein
MTILRVIEKYTDRLFNLRVYNILKKDLVKKKSLKENYKNIFK